MHLQQLGTNLRVRRMKRFHHEEKNISGRSEGKLALKQLEWGRRKGDKEREKREMKGKMKRREETVRKILTLYYQSDSVGAQSTISESNRWPIPTPCLSICFFFFQFQIMKHKWFWGKLKGIRSMRLWRNTEKHTQKKSIRVGSFLTSSRCSLQGEKHESTYTRNPPELQLFAARTHNTEKICCVGVQSSYLKRDGDTAMSRKEFPSHSVSWRHLKSG